MDGQTPAARLITQAAAADAEEALYPLTEHVRLEADTRRAAVAVVNIIGQWLELHSALDLGCGLGTWLRVLWDGGRREVMGVDIEPVPARDLAISPDQFLVADLGRKLDLHRRFDIVLCLEVAEHLDAVCADMVVENCVRHGDVVLFSAAIPGQQGVHHVNEQLPQYWAEKFRRHGFATLDLIRPLIWDDAQIPVWYRQNILLMAKEDSCPFATLLARVPPTRDHPLALAHPDYLSWFAGHSKAAQNDITILKARAADAQRRSDEIAAKLARERDNEAQARSAAQARLTQFQLRLQVERIAAEAAQNATLAARATALAARDSALAARDAALAARDSALSARDAALAARDSALAARDAALAARDQADTARQRSVRQAEQEAAGRSALERTVANLSSDLERRRYEADLLRWEIDIIRGSTLWRATEPLRRLGHMFSAPMRRGFRQIAATLMPGLRSTPHPEDALAQHPPEPTAPNPEQNTGPVVSPSLVAVPSATGSTTWPSRLVLISGEPDIPGHIYRVQRYTDIATSLGIDACWLRPSEMVPQEQCIARADVLLIWRAPNSPEIAYALSLARRHGVKVIFDVDDLMFEPSLASRHVIDGIRSQGMTEAAVGEYFQRTRETAFQADICTCTTDELASRFRALDRVALVLPNVFDIGTVCISRLAVRRRVVHDDQIVRIGYATGTRTHQRDFRNAAIALEQVLEARPQCRLVLFRDRASGRPLLDIAEYPALARLAGQIEWRDSVPLSELPHELARFDINLAPLEVGNVFCEAKSELKFFEAALVEVCTVASPVGPMRRAIRDGETGLLADTPEEWATSLRELIDDPDRRVRMAHAAYLDVLGRFGPMVGAASLRSALDQLAGGESSVRAFQLELHRRQLMPPHPIVIPSRDVIFASDQMDSAEVTVVVPLYNYAHYVLEALESVDAQTLRPLDLIVVDDHSTDHSVGVVLEWMRDHVGRFNRLILLRNEVNSGLGPTRNVGFDAAETPFVLPLDADNRLLPSCCQVCLETIRTSGAAFAYPFLQQFGGSTEVMGTEPFRAARFVSSNYVDALALISKEAWASVGGYADIRGGWEDYELWCGFVERGLWGLQIPRVLAEYRVHPDSMLHTVTDTTATKPVVTAELERRHPWLAIRAP
jgi:glycosyltransferase involved in cell wall biosynthesis/SAM-dependent methyltransferase